MRLGDRRRQRIELGVGEVAQVADRRQAVTRQHIERIGEIGAAVLARIGEIGNAIAQPVQRQLERRIRHREFLLAGASQKIGDVGIEPEIVAADAPEAERAGGVLPREQRLDGSADVLLGLGVQAQHAPRWRAR